MNKEFIPYEQALELKELGFDEPCFGSYVKLTETQNTFFMNDVVSEIDRETPLHESLITKAPLYQQAFRWFREKGLYHDIKMFGDWDKPQFSYIVSGRTIINATNPNHMWSYYKNANSYEEAELDCLNKLIEIVKQ